MLKTPTIEEVVSATTVYNMGSNRTPQRVSRTGIDETTPAPSRSRIRDVDLFSPTLLAGCIWNGSIVNIRQPTTPNFSKSSELNASVDKILTDG